MVSQYTRILVGVDGSATALAAARRAIELAAVSAAVLHVVDVVPIIGVSAPVGPAGSEALARHHDSAVSSASGALEHAQRIADERGVSTEVHLRHGDAAAGIVATAGEVAAELIVVGNRGVNPSGRYVLGSVPEAVLMSAPCDVLIVHTT